MKNFLSSMLGSLAALVIFTLGGLAVLVGLLVVISALGEKRVMVEDGSYLVFDLSANITDAPPLIDFRALMGEKTDTLQLRTVTQALQAAADDDRIKGVVLVGSLEPAGYGSGYAVLKEVREALQQFKASKKPVKAYLTYASTRDYYLASAADEVVLDPYGVILMPGLASEPMFLAGAFEKYGVGVQVTRVGKYKSAVEPYTRKDLSPENREQLQKLLGDVWTGLLADIATDRGIAAGDVQAVADTEGLIRAEAAKTAKLIDRIAYRDVVIDELKKATGRTGSKESFKQITLANYAALAPEHVAPARTGQGETQGKRGRIAVVYAEGEIVDGEGELGDVGGVKFARELRRLRQDDDVKAIVLRVNSPGGSASASEAIQREVRLALKAKPVVVSMGSYAASGGYWISTYSERIFAEPTTITGSIGVFGILFDVKKLANDFGVTFDSVKTGRFADMLTISRPKTEAELAMIQRAVDWIYDEFVGKVAESRKLKPDFVKEIAQGRVWSGAEAVKLGLVDEIGGLDAAMAYAAKQAGLAADYKVTEFPRKKEFAEAIAELIERVQPSAKASVYEQMLNRLQGELKALRAFNDPEHVYARMPLELTLR